MINMKTFIIISLYATLTACCDNDNSIMNISHNSTTKLRSEDSIDKFMNIVVHELTDIQQNEINDVSYTKIILILVILICILLLKVKFYKISKCFRRNHDIIETIKINEFNYNMALTASVNEKHENILNDDNGSKTFLNDKTVSIKGFDPNK
ncbi:hypothetical protein [Adoxophyes orana nucleopolyhedrovirus]|uniref:hypothetical protein n=1 Tax=Adoxophyes orana nucleopolyhedrovirus TaxID=542343 RepID=UPI0001829C46|nr:hypothetical protein [Adoxophyes orana nucleopolyhedrovirus]ACF05411.1 hypothetical protein [Adoxophyes orana nucleopolyhedrovirus]